MKLVTVADCHTALERLNKRLRVIADEAEKDGSMTDLEIYDCLQASRRAGRGAGDLMLHARKQRGY